MQHTVKPAAMKRLNIIAGQLEGLKRMVEKGEYCTEVIKQSLAIQRALNSWNGLILGNHLEEHVVHQMKHGEVSKAVKELLAIYELNGKGKT